MAGIKRGWFAFDDYISFGRLFDKLTDAGAYNVMYIPKSGMIYAYFEEDSMKAIKTIMEIEKYSFKSYRFRQVRGKLWMLQIKW